MYQHQLELDLTVLPQKEFRQMLLTLRPSPGESLSAMFNRLAEVLQENRAVVVRQEIFVYVAAQPDVMGIMQRQFGSVDWPITWTEGACCEGKSIAGTHVLAVAGADVQTIRLHNRPVGRLFADSNCRYCYLGDVLPTDRCASRPEQAKQAFQNMQEALEQVGMSMKNVIRTWLFLDDLLSWYGPFNLVRTDFFHQHNIFDGLVPASTGIGARNPASAALTIGAFAIQPLNDSVSAREIASPLQCPAPAYGSSFSRAVELTTPDYRQLLISGTASIAPEGQSVHIDDVDGQIKLTMEVVQAILASRQMDYSDVTRATLYFKHAKDTPAFEKYCKAQGIAHLPMISTHSQVCRDDLLFEIELDAAKTC